MSDQLDGQWPHHHEISSPVSAPPERVFALVDDHEGLGKHMAQRTWRMGWGRMQTDLDERRGQEVGSHIRMHGRVLGLELALDEVVVLRQPPSSKVWQTVGSPRLLVIGPYRMGVDIRPQGDHSRLRVFIDYALPASGTGRWLGRLFGHRYARWCTQSMVNEVLRLSA